MKPEVTVVVPNKYGERPDLTLRTLYDQSYPYFDVVVINDFDGNANRARNEGLKKVTTPYVLFSDNDIEWTKDALECMVVTLRDNQGFAYSYGAYEMGGRIYCNREFNRNELLRRNYISTMALVRTGLHPGFDERIKRLQDWDVWLTMMRKGHYGKYCGGVLFRTAVREGITTGSISWEEAVSAIKRKHRF